MTLQKSPKPIARLNRPQEPLPPFPYYCEDIIFHNPAAGIDLAGTLTLPTQDGGPFPAVLLVAGMGPHDRDYTMLDHKLFLVLADYLTQHDIAVLRYDKRGVGKSSGTYSGDCTSADFAGDALAGVNYLTTRPEIDQRNIGLIGHSEAGMFLPIVAAQAGHDVSFLVVLAGALITTVDQAAEQASLQLRADGATQTMIDYDTSLRRALLSCMESESDVVRAGAVMQEIFKTYWKQLPDEQKKEAGKLPLAISQSNAQNIINMFNSAWYRWFLKQEAVKAFEKTTLPVLALNGDKDFVTSPHIALAAIEKALAKAKNRDCTFTILVSMNHWFQTCVTGSLSEYGPLEETVSPVVLRLVTDWIVHHVTQNGKK